MKVKVCLLYVLMHLLNVFQCYIVFDDIFFLRPYVSRSAFCLNVSCSLIVMYIYYF